MIPPEAMAPLFCGGLAMKPIEEDVGIWLRGTRGCVCCCPNGLMGGAWCGVVIANGFVAARTPTVSGEQGLISTEYSLSTAGRETKLSKLTRLAFSPRKSAGLLVLFLSLGKLEFKEPKSQAS